MNGRLMNSVKLRLVEMNFFLVNNYINCNMEHFGEYEMERI